MIIALRNFLCIFFPFYLLFMLRAFYNLFTSQFLLIFLRINFLSYWIKFLLFLQIPALLSSFSVSQEAFLPHLRCWRVLVPRVSCWGPWDMRNSGVRRYANAEVTIDANPFDGHVTGRTNLNTMRADATTAPPFIKSSPSFLFATVNTR